MQPHRVVGRILNLLSVATLSLHQGFAPQERNLATNRSWPAAVIRPHTDTPSRGLKGHKPAQSRVTWSEPVAVHAIDRVIGRSGTTTTLGPAM